MDLSLTSVQKRESNRTSSEPRAVISSLLSLDSTKTDYSKDRRLLAFRPNNVSAEIKNERQDSDNNLDDKKPSHTYQHLVDTNLILPSSASLKAQREASAE